MVLSSVGWLNGITATGVFFFSCLFGLFFIYKARVKKIRLLYYLGLVYINAGLVYIGDTIDFITILITETNFENYELLGLLDWMWFPPAVICAIYIGFELIELKGRKIFNLVYIAMGIVFEIFLFVDLQGTITYDIPTNPGEDLFNDNIVFESVPSILALIFLISIIIVLGFGFMSKAIQSTGVIRRKFLFLSLGAFIYTIGAILDSLFSPGVILIVLRAGMILSAWLFYLGLRE
ncbi:MAG: hypothetical protein ACTSYC_03555 [Promethearchaeota archaeon]